MAITSLSAQYVSASFQNLVQVSSSGQLFDGAGNQITNLTASFAVTASYALNAGTGTSINTGSFATTGSNAFNGSQTVNGNLIVTGSLTVTNVITGSLFGTASFAQTASLAPNYVLTSVTSSMLAPYVLTSQTSSMSVASASVATSASYALTASYAVNSLTASYALSGGSGGTSATVATAQTGSVSSTTSETLIQTLTIPANTLATDNFARFSTKIFATNSSNYTVALYINSANTLNGSEKNITTLPVSSAIKFVVPTRTIAVNNVTTNTNWISENTQVQDPIQGTSATAHTSSFIDWTTTQYALVSVTPQNAGDSFICRGTYFEKI